MNSLTGGTARNTEHAPVLSVKREREKEHGEVDLSSGLVNLGLALRYTPSSELRNRPAVQSEPPSTHQMASYSVCIIMKPTVGVYGSIVGSVIVFLVEGNGFLGKRVVRGGFAHLE